MKKLFSILMILSLGMFTLACTPAEEGGPDPEPAAPDAGAPEEPGDAGTPAEETPAETPDEEPTPE